MKYLLTLGTSLLLFWNAIAQETTITASGILTDPTDGSAVIGATVFFRNVKDSTRSRYAISGNNGAFTVSKLEKAFYRVTIQSLGYTTYSRLVRVGETDIHMGIVTLEPDTKELEAVEIKGDVVPMEQKGDTTQYNADAFKVNPDASTKDLVSKMPGIVVDNNGITANGETVEQVLLDGKRFFGRDPLLSLSTIPAEVVQRVEVFDQLSEQSQFTGFNDGNTTKTMNVVTKEDKRNGQFGKLYAGYGTNDLYRAGSNINSFKKDQRLTVIGMSNNINQQNFSNEDLAGVSGGGGFRPGGGNNNFMTGTQNGITKANFIGLNFTDNWGKAVTFEGSYFFNNTRNANDQDTKRESFLANETQYYNEEQNSSTDNLNHRLNTRITYTINKDNKLILRPSLSVQDNSSDSYTKGVTTNEGNEILNQTENDYQSNNKAYNFANELIFQHKFDKIGRTISVDVNTQMNSIDRTNHYESLSADSVTEYLTTENLFKMGSGITYSEPVGNTGQLSASYELDYNNRTSDKNTYIENADTEERRFISSLSNNFVSGYTTHVSSLHFANRAFGKFFDIGIAYQYATLNNDQQFPEESSFSKSFNSVLPIIMGRIELKGGGNIFLRYAGSTSEPSVSQLQSVTNNSNPLFLSTGNPGLSQSYTHTLMMRTSKSNVEKNTSLANFTRIQATDNYITRATMIVRQDTLLSEDISAQKGAQISRPINVNGYWNITNNTTYSFLISKLKSNLNSSVGLSYRRLPGETNGIQNISNTYSANLRFSLVSNFSKDIDFNIYYNASGNLVENSIQSCNNSNYITQTVGGKLNLIFGKGFVFRNDISYLKYDGVNDASDFGYTLWNMGIARKFLKNDLGELELSVFDLLRQNQSISQNVNSTYIEEVRTQVLQQYFMLTFTYQLRKFG